MSYLRSCGGSQLWILIQLWIHICVVPFEGPLRLWLQAHLCLSLDYVEQGQLWIWIQLQINICVVHFDLNFHCIDIMVTLCYLEISIFCPIILFQ